MDPFLRSMRVLHFDFLGMAFGRMTDCGVFCVCRVQFFSAIIFASETAFDLSSVQRGWSACAAARAVYGWLVFWCVAVRP